MLTRQPGHDRVAVWALYTQKSPPRLVKANRGAYALWHMGIVRGRVRSAALRYIPGDSASAKWKARFLPIGAKAWEGFAGKDRRMQAHGRARHVDSKWDRPDGPGGLP